jgi:hypothetical protein
VAQQKARSLGYEQTTRDVEFYGSSSSVAILSHILQTEKEDLMTQAIFCLTSIILHLMQVEQMILKEEEEIPRIPITASYSQYRTFIDALFSTIHYVHSILDRDSFLRLCDALWSDNELGSKRLTSIVTLYYSILSIGALVGTRDDDLVDVNERQCLS